MVLIQLLLGQQKMYLDPDQNNCGNLCNVSLGIESVSVLLAEEGVAGNLSRATPSCWLFLHNQAVFYPAFSDCAFSCSQKYLPSLVS